VTDVEAGRPARSPGYSAAMRLRRTPLAVAVLVAVALAGCGGDEKDTKIDTKAEFIAAADKICVERDTRGRQLVRESQSDVAKLTRGLADAYMTAITKLEALDLPPGAARAGAAAYVKSVTDMRRPVQRMRASAEKFGASDTVAEIKKAGTELGTNVNTVQAISDLADQNARKYGMKRCGKQQQLPIT
jgi:type IV pilus biogenesis protein CpaD/CtpE